MADRGRLAFFGAIAVAICAGAGAADAADLGGRPSRPPPAYTPPPPPPPLQIERWTGFYFGGALGYGFGQADVSGDIGAQSFDQNGWIGSIYAGYNWQFGNAVLGLETDVGTGNFGGTVVSGVNSISTDLNALGSFRARAGYLLGPALLVYATGGFAWANTDLNLAGGESKSQTFTGYQLGAGGELLISPNWALRVEYLFTNLSDESVTLSGVQNRFDPDFHAVRAGIAFKF